MKKRRKTISHLSDDFVLYVARLQKKSPQVFFAEREVDPLLFSQLKGSSHKQGRDINIFKELKINGEINASELRVISESGEMLGVMSLSQALRLSDEAELDLVCISPTANPPVAKIVDYGKFKFETLRKEKEQKKAQKIVKIKEVQLSLNIQENEVAFKREHARRFIEDGNKVKVCINRIRGRATANADKGVAIIQNFYESLSDIADIDQPAAKSGIPGRNINIVMVIGPKKSKK